MPMNTKPQIVKGIEKHFSISILESLNLGDKGERMLLKSYYQNTETGLEYSMYPK
jgi:hypothetical protein